MMDSDGQAVEEEEDEREPPHRIAVQAPAGSLRRHGIERDVGRDEPEIDDGVQRPREQRAGQADVDGRIPAERGGDDLEEKLRRDPGRGPEPQDGIGDGREHGERHRLIRIGALPARHGDNHEPAPDPGADHHEDNAEVIEQAPGQGRVEGVEHRRLPGEDRGVRHERADHGEPQSDPGQARIRDRTGKRRLGDVVAEAHDEQGRHHVGHRRAVRRDGGEIGLGGQEGRREGAADPHLPDPEHGREREDREGEPEMRQDQTFSVRHSWPFPRRPA
jgi:hypothetical protein